MEEILFRLAAFAILATCAASVIIAAGNAINEARMYNESRIVTMVYAVVGGVAGLALGIMICLAIGGAIAILIGAGGMLIFGPNG